jgi:hypothetical protein
MYSPSVLSSAHYSRPNHDMWHTYQAHRSHLFYTATVYTRHIYQAHHLHIFYTATAHTLDHHRTIHNRLCLSEYSHVNCHYTPISNGTPNLRSTLLLRWRILGPCSMYVHSFLNLFVSSLPFQGFIASTLNFGATATRGSSKELAVVRGWFLPKNQGNGIPLRTVLKFKGQSMLLLMKGPLGSWPRW